MSKDPLLVISARILLGVALAIGLWISLQPTLSLSRWTPQDLMRGWGIPYGWILAYEHALPYLLHAVAGAVLLVLVSSAALFGPLSRRANLAGSFLSVLCLAGVAEGTQHLVGRGFDPTDLACTAAGMLLVAGPLRRG